jgi:hypothetical protein
MALHLIINLPRLLLNFEDKSVYEKFFLFFDLYRFLFILL